MRGLTVGYDDADVLLAAECQRQLFKPLHKMLITLVIGGLARSDHAHRSHIMLTLYLFRKGSNGLPALVLYLYPGKMPYQRIFQSISQRDGGTFFRHVRFVVAYTEVKIRIHAVGVDDYEHRRIVGRKRVVYGSEFIGGRLAHVVDHFGYPVKTHVVYQIAFEGLCVTHRDYVHLREPCEVFPPHTLLDYFEPVLP